MHEREPQEATVEPAAPLAAPASAPQTGLAGTPAFVRGLQARVGNAIVSRALALQRDAVAEDAVAEGDVTEGAVAEGAVAEDAVALGGGGAAPAAAKGPAPTFDHSGGATVTINADSAVAFSNAITSAIGSPHTSPKFEPDIQVGWKTTESGQEVPGTRKITSIGLKVTTSITKVRFGMGRVDKENKAMIDRMVAEIQAHEVRHRQIIETAATAALAAAQKLVGTSKEVEANAALTTKLESTTNAQHEALDAAEGLLTVTEVRQPDGTITLQLAKSASGAKYPH